MSGASVRRLIAVAALLVPANAAASSVEGYPEQGSEPLGRGGAWVARATDPIALARNPAGLAGQPLRLSAGEDLPFSRTCFARVKAATDTTDDGVAPGGTYPKICDSAGTLPVGYAAIAIPLGQRVGLGAGVVTPTGIPRHLFPADGAQRYLLVESTTLMAIPTVGAGFEVLPNLRIGGAFGWGIASVRTTAAGVGLLTTGMRPAENDTRVTVSAFDGFVPRATAGAHASLGAFELGAAVTWSAPIEARGDARTETGARVVAHGDTATRDCGQPGGSACGDGGNARLTVPIPLEATLGVRYRVRRGDASVRDPLETELGDVELDVSWAQDSAVDAIGLHFTPNIPVPGTAGVLPSDASSPRRFRDVFGVHAGGDLALVPGVLALRGGAFVEPRAGTPGQVGLETLAGTRIGVALGATVRIRDKNSAFDVSAGLLHVFVSDLTSTGSDGFGAIAGVPPYRTPWPTSLGTISGGLDVVHVGVAYRF